MDVYSSVETLQAIFGAPDAYTAKYSMTYLREIYNNHIYVSLQNACDKIAHMDSTIFMPEYMKVVGDDRYL
jgi:hypothetical protein